MKNYYTILGVEQGDSTEVIRKSYRKLAKQYHPDLNPNDSVAEMRCREINEAWETLGDTAKREKYDLALAKEANKPSKRAKATTAPMEKVDFGDLMVQFESFFGKGMQNPASQEKTKNPLDASGLFEQYMGIKK